jgi:hypothetical protein
MNLHTLAPIADEHRIAIQAVMAHGEAEDAEYDHEIADALAAARMARAIELGQQRETLEAGERVRVVEGSWCHLLRLPEDCFYCKRIGHEKWHHTGIITANKKSAPNSFSDPGFYRFQRDCGRVDVVRRHCLAHGP